MTSLTTFRVMSITGPTSRRPGRPVGHHSAQVWRATTPAGSSPSLLHGHEDGLSERLSRIQSDAHDLGVYEDPRRLARVLRPSA